jgi:hypothetical protein
MREAWNTSNRFSNENHVSFGSGLSKQRARTRPDPGMGGGGLGNIRMSLVLQGKHFPVCGATGPVV